MTCFSVFDIPVFWPILVLYFLALFGMNMKNQIAHMIKYRYVPCSWGKKRYARGGGGGGVGSKDKLGKDGPSLGGAPPARPTEPRFTGSNLR
jgi:hypothetical protein